MGIDDSSLDQFNTTKMNPIKRWIDNQKIKVAKQRRQTINEEFKITEKDGSIWLTHLGIAFREFPHNMKAQEIAKALNETRETAVRYEGYAPSTTDTTTNPDIEIL